MILLQEADFGIAYFLLTHDRFKVVDYLTPIQESPLTFLVPVASEHFWSKCFRPLSSQVWMCTLGGLLTAWFIIWLLQPRAGNCTKKAILSAFEYSIRMQCLQGKLSYSLYIEYE